VRESVTHNMPADETTSHPDNVDNVERSGWAGRLRSVLRPLPRAGGYYASSWSDFLLRKDAPVLAVKSPRLWDVQPMVVLSVR
jgi:hypothetical protein